MFATAGPNVISVVLDNQHVVASPVTISVQPSTLWLPACEVVWPQGRETEAGRAMSVTLIAADRCGNVVGRGGASLEVAVRSRDRCAATGSGFRV
jgi:hypothetical protein